MVHAVVYVMINVVNVTGVCIFTIVKNHCGLEKLWCMLRSIRVMLCMGVPYAHFLGLY